MATGHLAHIRRAPAGGRLRLGFVGGGRGGLVGDWHASGARLSNRWDIVAGALSSDPERAALSAQDWAIAPDRAYGDWRDMARAEAARADGIDAVVVCTPNHTHHPIAAGFLDAGIDVICDKPMTNSVEEAQDLRTRTGGSGPTLLLTYPYVHHAMVRQARAMVAAGEIGELRQIRIEYLQDGSMHAAGPDDKGQLWRRDPATAGRSSAVADIGTHAYHMLHHVTGREVEALRAEFHTCGAPQPLEDTAFVSLRLTGGVPVLMHISQAAPGQFCGFRFHIWGSAGGLSWDQEYPEDLRHTPLDGPERIVRRGQGAGIVPEAAQLVHLPRGHGEALTDAWANLYAALAIAIGQRRAGQTADLEGLCLSGADEGLQGVRFVHACADSHARGGAWTDLGPSGW
ncbi:Gfo/Idh/MocA family protein [Histidinibacterium lentulum]|uniref:Gfo/Idh/MocA family oxidoreductase n=1 Tax=Histidinibacterium lentulum TaxID=2480588 RepID=A0A3N2R8C2_9RHOB|nr:Gfo/Idh/MocA family oxidoreductase [Histidinibacterium lentulum]ROU03704.1 gfo/Idh/MocA family oxidoreductase [Histidinibacterium lentulum]